MRTALARAIVSIVNSKRTRLTVELESRAEPISGQILDSSGRVHEFSGYMGLIEALERLRPSVASGVAAPRAGGKT